jgi:hypothetical protein
MREIHILGRGGGSGTGFVVRTDLDSLDPKCSPRKLIEHFGACLRALAERDGRPRSDHARFLLPLAELLKIRHRTAGSRESFARTDLCRREGRRDPSRHRCSGARGMPST